SYVNGAAIQNLVVAGVITGTASRAAGIVGETGSSLSHVTNCLSSVNVSGGQYVGGISVGGNVEITGCVFNGTIVGTSMSGGFVGYSNSTPVISDCLFAPQEGSTLNGGTFYYNGGGEITPINSYYTVSLGTPQGKQAHSIAGGEYVTVAFSGQATTYNVSGIIAYSVGMVYNNTCYAGEGDAVSLNLGCTIPDGYTFLSYQASAGTLTGSTNPYTLTMPDADVTLQAVLRLDSVHYMDADSVLYTRSDFTVLTDTETTLEAGWYVVDHDIIYDTTLTLNGDVTLILCNGNTMTVASQSGGGITSGSLTIYGQSLNPNVAGTLNVTNNHWMGAISPGTYIQHSGNVVANNSDGDALNGNVTINGGSIQASSVHIGINCDNLTINGGSIDASGSSAGIVVGQSGNLTINGGNIDASGFSNGIALGQYGNLTINGGTITAISTNDQGSGLFIQTGNLVINGGKVDASKIYSGGNITLGWTNTDDYIQCGSYQANGTISVKSGQAFYYEDGGEHVIVSDTLNSSQIRAIWGKTLRPRFVNYMDGDGEMHYCSDYTVLTGNETTLDAGWYVVDHDITYDTTLTLNGDVTLILCDYKTMTVALDSCICIFGDNNLTIYGQSLDSIAGTLNVTNHYWQAALSADNITINSGSINATGGDYGAGIGGTITINGGSINATGGDSGAGISGTITINGGSIHANGSAFGLYADGLTIIMNGGSVHANVGKYGIIAGNLTVNGGSIEASSNGYGYSSINANNLIIYGGSIEANGVYDGISANDLTVNGGSIMANGINHHGIIVNNLTINDGSIEAYGNSNVIIANSALTINGGMVEASNISSYNNIIIKGGKVEAYDNISSNKNIIINGGKVEAFSIFANNSNITLGWTNTDDYIRADSYSANNGDGIISVKSGQAFYYEEYGEYVIVSDTLNEDQIDDIRGKTLRPYIVPVTLTKDIAGYGDSEGGWQLIALPLYGALDPISVGDLIADTATYYDLYRFEPSHEGNEWENYKSDSAFVLENGKGYLYANADNVTLTFSGPAYIGNICEIELAYDANDERKCWNLVGNPFTSDATLDRVYYVLSADGTDINPEPIPANTPVPPCTAVFVKAVTVGDKAVFTQVTP
ncbi:MAG: hypothetical protein IKX56_03815, partial [Muribaculaceae bacterium]|nr:hypothetical protein [Muribaculaceae bacterium]